MMTKKREKNPYIERLELIRWPGGRDAALELETELAELVVIRPLESAPKLVAGVDAAFTGGHVTGAACLMSYPGLELVAEAVEVAAVRFPYIPGLLSFREGGVIIAAIEALPERPDVVIFDGQGISHPRGLGVASFVGAVLDIPTVGSAKSRLVGDFSEPGAKRGLTSELVYRGRAVGAVVRTRDNTRPLFVSPGHRIDIPGAIELVLATTRGFRLTEPVRCADRMSKVEARRMRERKA